jgi:hypothetical protein
MNPNDELFIPIAQRLGLDALIFDDSGLCPLVFDDRFTITLELDEDGDTLHLYSTLGQAPEDLIDQLTCFAGLLEANLFGRGTGGATLSFEPDGRYLVINQSLSLQQSNPEALQTLFERFVQAADAWHDRVSNRFWQDPDFTADNSPAAGIPTFIKV